jgi:peptidoglycan hydrolase-like protein with peptidoglycan-binding domain
VSVPETRPFDPAAPGADRVLRVPRARRAADSRRRRVRRGRRAALAATGALALMAGGAVAAPGFAHETETRASTRASGSISAAQRALGVPADGIVGPVTRRAVRRFQRANGLTVDGILGPRTRAALGVGAAPAASARGASAGGAGPSAALRRIASCESGGDPTAVSPGGRHRGKYQFTLATWRGLGGTGDPAAAPEAVQDEMAAALYARRGSAPWPNCG